jgi:uridine phosphorylase
VQVTLQDKSKSVGGSPEEADPLPPILEYDDSPTAFIEPSENLRRVDVPEHCVICFFREVIEKVSSQPGVRVAIENRWEDGPHNLFETELSGQKIAFYHPGVGAALSSALLEEAIARGCRKFVACGGCGVLEKDMAMGRLIVVTAAVRDEGVSYHYLPAGREVIADENGIEAIQSTLENNSIPFVTGKTWTTDAPYRETRKKIATRQNEGCIAVEMEAAGMMAVARFRGVPFAQVLYAGDDVSGEEWEHRGWQKAGDVREQLFQLAAESCLLL